MSKVFVEPDYVLLFMVEYVTDNPDYSKLVSYINTISIEDFNKNQNYIGNLTLGEIIKLSMIKDLFIAYMARINKSYHVGNLLMYMKKKCMDILRYRSMPCIKYVKEQTEEICLSCETK